MARIEAAVGASGKVVRALLDHYETDPAWGTDLAAVRGSLAGEDRAWHA